MHLLFKSERTTLVVFLYKCFWKKNSNVNSTNFTAFLEKIIKVLISQFWKRNHVGNFMNMVKNVLFLVAKFQNHVFVWSKQYRRMLNFIYLFFFNLIFKNYLMDDHDFNYFIILNTRTHTLTHNLIHLKATPINLKSIFLWKKSNIYFSNLITCFKLLIFDKSIIGLRLVTTLPQSK